jgi:RNA polymerase sigma-70 factor (ECF subfamily)
MQESMSEEEAIRRAQNGDPAAQGRLYDLHRLRIYSLCLHYTADPFDAEDLTQDAFIQVFRKIGTFRGDARFTSWLYKIALNYVRLRARQRRREDRFGIRHVPEEVLYMVEASSSNPAQSLALKQALSRLTSLRRETVQLHDIEGFTHNEIAWRLGVTVIASKSRLHRAHVALRNFLGKSRREIHSRQEKPPATKQDPLRV